MYNTFDLTYFSQHTIETWYTSMLISDIRLRSTSNWHIYVNHAIRLFPASKSSNREISFVSWNLTQIPMQEFRTLWMDYIQRNEVNNLFIRKDETDSIWIAQLKLETIKIKTRLRQYIEWQLKDFSTWSLNSPDGISMKLAV